jgi:hypothetical protein
MSLNRSKPLATLGLVVRAHEIIGGSSLTEELFGPGTKAGNELRPGNDRVLNRTILALADGLL